LILVNSKARNYSFIQNCFWRVKTILKSQTKHDWKLNFYFWGVVEVLLARKKANQTHTSYMFFDTDTHNKYKLLVFYLYLGLIALLDPYLSKSCGYGPLTNLNTKQTLMFWFFGSFGPPTPLLTWSLLTWHPHPISAIKPYIYSLFGWS